MPGTLHSGGDATLVARTGTRASPWQDLATIGYMALQSLNIFVVRRPDLVGAEHAYFAPWRVAPSATGLWRSTFPGIHPWRRRGAPAIIIAATALAATHKFISHLELSLSTTMVLTKLCDAITIATHATVAGTAQRVGRARNAGDLMILLRQAFQFLA